MRLKKSTSFRAPRSFEYFDDVQNAKIMHRVAGKAYLPSNKLILKLIRHYNGAFRVAYSITGVAIEQMRLYTPEVLDSFMELAETGCVEFLAETYYHTLASLYDTDEFEDQLKKHGSLMQELFGQKPRVFRNTELIYNDCIGQLAESLGYKIALAEGADDVLGWRSPNFIYRPPDSQMRLLLKNYKLSDDIAFRFSCREWKEYPLSAEKYAHWIHALTNCSQNVGLFMDYETFGEHQWESTGIFRFLEEFPEQVLKDSRWNFQTPSEAAQAGEPVGELHYPRLTSWADVKRDTSAWQGNHMQSGALKQLYEIGPALRESGDEFALDLWRKFQTSDHFYYMSTKSFADGDVHAYFNPYESPYDAFIYFMNAFSDFKKYYPEKHYARVIRQPAVTHAVEAEAI